MTGREVRKGGEGEGSKEVREGRSGRKEAGGRK